MFCLAGGRGRHWAGAPPRAREPPMTDAARSSPPSSTRWTALVLVSLAMFGNYYVYDCVNPLEDLFASQLGVSAAQFGLLQGVYSVPNVFLPLFGGILIDRLGVRRSLLLFAGVCMLGAALTASTAMFTVIVAGRLLFGMGAESLVVASSTALAKWFHGREIGFAFGINLTIARLGSWAADNSPIWAEFAFHSWQRPLQLALVFAAVSVLSALAYAWLERRVEARHALAGGTPSDRVDLKGIGRLGRSYWFVVALCFTFYSGIFPFRTFAVKMLQSVHGLTLEEASFLNSTLIIAAMIFTPLFGLLVDRIGRRALLMVAGSLLLLPTYAILMYGSVPPQVPVAMMGMAFALIPAVMWPAVAYLVDLRYLGTALGLMTMVQNVGLAGFNFLIGWANARSGASVDNPGGYGLGVWIFTALAATGFMFALLLRRAETGPHARGLEVASPPPPPA